MNRKRFRNVWAPLLAGLLVFSLSGCGLSRIKDIQVRSAGVKYVVPTSLTSLDGVLTLEIDNPAPALTLSHLSGYIVLEGKRLVGITTGVLPLKAGCVEAYELPCTLSLLEGTTLLDILRIASSGQLGQLKAEVSGQVSLEGGRVNLPLSFKDIDFLQFTRK